MNKTSKAEQRPTLVGFFTLLHEENKRLQLDYTPEGDRCIYCNADAYTCEHLEDAEAEARLDAQAEYEDQQRAWRDA